MKVSDHHSHAAPSTARSFAGFAPFLFSLREETPVIKVGGCMKPCNAAREPLAAQRGVLKAMLGADAELSAIRAGIDEAGERALGFDEHLAKPIDAGTLVRKVAGMLTK